MPRVDRILALAALTFAGCSGSTEAGSGAPAQVVVTVVTGIGAPTTSVGFPTTLPHGGSTLQVSGLDSLGRTMTLDPVRYRFDVTPAAVAGFYFVTPTTNTTLGIAVLQAAASLPFTWKLTDVTTSRIVVGPTLTNVLLQ